METTTQAVSESVALLASPAGMQRMTVAVRDLLAGDVIVGGRGRDGGRLVVAAMDGGAGVGCCIVDFTDGTATAPVAAMLQVAIDRATEGGAA